MKEVTYFIGFNKPTENKLISSVIIEIKNGTYKNQIEEIRTLIITGEVEKASTLKKNLLAFTPSATFKGGRKIEFIENYNQIIVLDFDNISKENYELVFDKIKDCEYTYCCFRSPSGNGIKVLCSVKSKVNNHKIAFHQLSEYYENLTEVKIDPSGKDVTRLCYISFDPETFYNENSSPFEILFAELKNDNEIETKFQNCKQITNKKQTYSEGNRNNYIHQLANNCNREGITEMDVLNFISRDYDLEIDEINSAVNSAYKNTNEHNTNDVKSKKPLIDKVEAFLISKYEFRYNVVTGKVEYKSIHSNKFQAITDFVELSMLREIQKSKIKCNQTSLRCILGSDFCEIYNPFHSYLNSLTKWNEQTDYINELAATVKTTNDEYWYLCLKKWIIATVGSLIDDATTNQTVLVFSGKQGLGKTTWLGNLVPKELSEYLFSGTINPNNKDTLIHLSECMLINLDELENLSKSEIGSLKEIITKSVIRMRKAYGHNNESMIRRASFVGSVNTSQFLNDTTGSRRFLCFEVLEIEYKHKVNMSNVLAQAMYYYKSNFQYWFDKNEIAYINENNEQYQLKSIEEEMLITWFEIPTEKEHTFYLSTSQIAAKLSQFGKLQVTNATLNHLGKALKKNGFNRVKKNSVWVYEVRELSFNEVDKKSKN
jgi:predicted P-loop ATPase